VRENREVVMNKVFEAFTTHEYYRLQDLQQLTKQPPVSYLLTVFEHAHN
jgi:hypothetical protein